MNDLTFRFATAEDADDIVRLTRALAATMGRDGEVAATAADVRRHLCDERAGEAVLVEHAIDGVVGYALFGSLFSAWKGARCAYVEDLYIEEAYRGGGVGRALMAHIASLCEQRGWTRLSWHCRDTNEAGLRFYERIGAECVDALLLHRLDGDALDAIAAEAEAI